MFLIVEDNLTNNMSNLIVKVNSTKANEKSKPITKGFIIQGPVIGKFGRTRG